jgi:hypothetical protein
MTGSAGLGLALHDLAVDDLRAPKRDQMLAAREASFRHVGDEAGMWVTKSLGPLFVLGYLPETE